MKKNISKIFMIFGISILVIALLGSTLAYYVWNTSSDEETKIVTSVGAATVYFDGGSIIENAGIRPVESKEYGIEKNISIKANTAGLIFNMYLDLITLPDALRDESFKYAFYKDETLIQEGNFSSEYLTSNTTSCSTNNTTHLTLLTNETILTTTTTYTLYIWIDGVNYTNPNTMMNQEFSFKLHADGENALLKEGPIPDIGEIPDAQKKSLAYKILSDYYYADKSDILNNDVTYHYDTEHSLMADIGGNVRYYGASPNNYIYFNCSDYSNQSDTTCEKWRIIGVFDGKVKIIRNESIGNLAWDYDKNIDSTLTTFDNDWSTASLQALLNQKYYNGNISDAVIYYSETLSGESTSTSLNMTDIGIKNDTTRSMISEALWNLGSFVNCLYSDTVYNQERGTSVYTGRPTTWTGNIALAYPSDYGYAADFNSCSKNLYNYNDSTCTSVNWMFSIYAKSYGWFLSPHFSTNNLVYVSSAGNVYGNGYNSYSKFSYGVVPALYLSSKLEIKSGDGSLSLPYQLQQ
ncbi:MAG: hypothetical protein ACI310_03775 [Bacilli bacterium]